VMICLALVIFVASQEEMMRLAGSQEKVAEGKLSTYRHSLGSFCSSYECLRPSSRPTSP
jgi:hypothetical protein